MILCEANETTTLTYALPDTSLPTVYKAQLLEITKSFYLPLVQQIE